MEVTPMELRFPLILDGATGTELQKRGYTGDVCAEQWTLDHPDAIIDIQRGYVDSGSQVLYTPTFGANRRKLEEHGIFNRTEDYNRRLAALSEQASGGRALRAGDISPTGLFLSPLGEASFEELVDIYTEQAAGLEQADHLAGELLDADVAAHRVLGGRVLQRPLHRPDDRLLRVDGGEGQQAAALHPRRRRRAAGRGRPDLED